MKLLVHQYKFDPDKADSVSGYIMNLLHMVHAQMDVDTHSALLHMLHYSILHCDMLHMLTYVVQNGRTVLHTSSSKGDVGMIKFILEQFNPNLEAVEEVC